jgi:hypothetical protein
MEDVLTTEYDGCGRCLVAVRIWPELSLIIRFATSDGASASF